MGNAHFSFPTAIDFGVGSKGELPGAVKALGCSRPLVVTDGDLVRLPVFDDVMGVLQGIYEIGVFSGVGGNPVASQVDEGVRSFRAHRADVIIALGGGAALDVAKAVALMVYHPGQVFDYEDGKPDGLPVDQAIPPIVAIPTTAGTGSEVGRSAVISGDEDGVKRVIFHPRLLPVRVLIDPELTVSLPPGLTAATGLDALSHCVEAFLAPGFHPLCDGIALEGVRLISRSLQRAYDVPGDLAARGEMMAAAMMGAIAFQKGLGLTHSMAHALSTVCGLHHGLANGILLGRVVAFNSEAVPDRVSRLAEAADLKDRSPAGFLAWFDALASALNIPASLGAVGVEPSEHLEALTRYALADGCHQTNPRPVDAQMIRTLFLEAI